MNEILKAQLARYHIEHMVSPVIIMNPDDLKDLIKTSESEVVNLSIKSKPRYEGVPIISQESVQRDCLIVFDEFNQPKHEPS